MRFLRVLPLLLAVAFIWALNHSFGSLPAIGKIIDPVNGAMANAEDWNEDWNRNLHLKDLKAPVQIWLDTSLIPHIRAGNDHDLYYAQGYIHATFRLWQMDLQTRAAWGRVSEVAGPKAIDFDRGMRREGMVWGAQHSLETMEADPRTKAMLDAYRDGINAYIHTLNFRCLPIEYKLMGFVPEDWTNLRTALLMKYMARDLTGKTDDIAYTQLRDQLGQEEFDFLFPERIKGSKPVIPEGTKFAPASLPAPKAPGGDVWAHFNKSGSSAWERTPVSRGGLMGGDERRMGADERTMSAPGRSIVAQGARMVAGNPLMVDGGRSIVDSRPRMVDDHPRIVDSHPRIVDDHPQRVIPGQQGLDSNPSSEISEGSNNWAISGAHTASGKPILCNDPHLALNLPSLWYEMQLTAPGINAYGASLPGAPGIVIGFNDKISWGFTNNYRDVKDFYEITHADTSFADSLNSDTRDSVDGMVNGIGHIRSGYRFAGKVVPFGKSIEVIKVKGQPDVIDFVRYTIHGPVTYDPSFPDPAKSGKLLACTWMAHRGSNELLATYLLNRAGDYPAFTDAISHFECPAQNIAYADGAGNIAMWAQGRFINKWKGQGKYVMCGDDSATLWGDAIPWQENPHVLNPPQGYVASANQQVTDSTYPYWYNQSFTEWRAWRINGLMGFYNHWINDKPQIASIENNSEYFSMMSLQNDATSNLNYDVTRIMNVYVGKSIWEVSKRFVDKDTTSIAGPELEWYSTTASLYQTFWSQLYKDIWQDDFPTGTKYPSSELTVQLLLSDSTSGYYDDKRTQQVETLRDVVQRAFKETTDSLEKLKRSTGLEWYKVKNTSLTHLARLPAFSYDHLKIGGWSNTINACTGDHGPSWRMIVEMDSIPRAYAIYPGGQSGNPGSRHYSDFINQWVEGKYHAIQFLAAITTKNPLKYTWTLTP